MPSVQQNNAKKKNLTKKTSEGTTVQTQTQDTPNPAVNEQTALVPFANLPAVLDGQAVDIPAQTAGGAFVQFMSARASNWIETASKIPGLKEGDAVLHDGGTVHHLRHFKAHLLAGRHFWTEVQADGSITDAWTEKPADAKENKQICESVETVLLVHVGNAIRPARCTFRRGQCPAAKSLADALRAASTPQWAERGDAYKASLVYPKPFLRFYGAITSGQRTSKQGGMKYIFAESSIHPSGPTEVLPLSQYFQGCVTDVKMKESFDLVFEGYERRVLELENLASGG